MGKSFDEIFSEIEFLLSGYSSQYRTSVQPYRYKQRASQSGYRFDPLDETVRESLPEHVGTLPILAAYFHGHVTEPVALGRALEMLAIHDIGELGCRSGVRRGSRYGRPQLVGVRDPRRAAPDPSCARARTVAAKPGAIPSRGARR